MPLLPREIATIKSYILLLPPALAHSGVDETLCTCYEVPNCVFVALMPIAVYDHIMHAGRNASGMVVAALICFPQMDTLMQRVIMAWWVLPTLVWLIPVLKWAPCLSKI
jgi:hypothetical protein